MRTNLSNQRLKEEVREQIRVLTLRGFSDTKISQKLSLPRSLVEYHYNKVRKSIEFTNRKDLIDSFDTEYAIIRASFQFRKERLEEMLDNNPHPIVKIQIEKLIHQIDVDRWKLLGDNEIVLAVRRMKDERASNGITKRTAEPIRTTS